MPEELVSPHVGDITDRVADLIGTGSAPPEPVGVPGSAAPTLEALPENIPDDMVYRDAHALREQVTQTRQRYQPYATAFDGLDDARRDALLKDAPNIAEVLYDPSLTGEDRQALLAMADALRTGNVGQAAQMAAQWNDALSQYNQPAPDPVELGGPDEPMTRAQFDQMMAERDYNQTVQGHQSQIMHELRDLGYDPDATTETERARVGNLLYLAGEYGGDIAKAHETMQAERQSVIDDYLASKTADAGRTAAVPVGGSPSPERQIENLTDAKEAAREFLSHQFGGPQG